MHRSSLSIAFASVWIVACAHVLSACGAPGEGAAAPRRAPASKSAAEIDTESAAPAASPADPHGGATTAAPAAPAAETAAPAPAVRGQQLYAQMCAVCHGANGEGYKADQATALAHPDFLASVHDEFLRLAIVNGRKNTTMSAWAQERGGPLAPADVDALIAFLRTWDKKPRAELDRRELTGDPQRGQKLYERECRRCHGARGRGGPNVNIGDPELFTSAGLGFLRLAIHDGRTGTSMPAYGKKLGDRGIDDVLAYLLRAVSMPEGRVEAPAPVPPPPIPLGPVPLNPKGPEPEGFARFPGVTSVDVVHAQLERGARMALLDARAPSDYANEHIAGAVSVPFYDPSPYLKHLPKNVWLVSYCACPHAESKTLAQKLTDAGFSKVTVLNEGLGVWRSRGYPVHTGRKP